MSTNVKGTRRAYRDKMAILLKTAEESIVNFDSENDAQFDNLLILKDRISEKYEIIKMLDTQIINDIETDELSDVVLEADDYLDDVYTRKYKIC